MRLLNRTAVQRRRQNPCEMQSSEASGGKTLANTWLRTHSRRRGQAEQVSSPKIVQILLIRRLFTQSQKELRSEVRDSLLAHTLRPEHDKNGQQR